jgi:HSP20 family protein
MASLPRQSLKGSPWAMRMEEYVASGRYVVRAELPGVDPAKDMEVSVA